MLFILVNFFFPPILFGLFNLLYILYCSPITVRVIKSRKLRWAGQVARMEGRNAFKILIGTPTGNIPLGRPMRRWEDNIRMDLKEIGTYLRN